MPLSGPENSLPRPAAPVGRLGNPWRSLLLRLAARIEVGRLDLRLPDGSVHVFEGRSASTPRAVIGIARDRAARRLVTDGVHGFAEAYVDGDWDSPDLGAVVALALANQHALGRGFRGVGIAGWIERLRHRLRANTRRGSRRNIAYHYDLGNAFYTRWLDPGMTYSSALFEPDVGTLAEAQDRKYARLAAALELAPGQHVLEIGCGWGGFAIRAARDHGCRVTALTLSVEQRDHALAEVRRLGLGDRIDVRLQDYRDIDGVYDRIASIEMFEAVGEANWPTYFDVVRDRLAPGGIAGLQVITIADERFRAYRRGADFIQRHVFPGGMLPSPGAFRRTVEAAGLRLAEEFTFGDSYARTLAAWQRRFQGAWPEIRALGFDERFKRLWEFYLAYCEAGFRAGTIDVLQARIERA